MWPLTFISERDFVSHVQSTIAHYGKKLKPYNLRKFNGNIIDPIKLIFDKAVYQLGWEDVIKNEIFRQRDKANNNEIGYFHQNLFKYVRCCTVPKTGWDVIYKKEDGISLPNKDIVHTVYVELKNKHNTMNTAASGKTYTKMQKQLLDDDDCACFLVEVIAKRSQNAVWATSVDGNKKRHRRIRRVSMDHFYSLVTGQRDAFYQMCLALPGVVEKVVAEAAANIVPLDTAVDELNAIAQSKRGSFALALYMLGFGSYSGFK
jgi:hypothetical protein